MEKNAIDGPAPANGIPVRAADASSATVAPNMAADTSSADATYIKILIAGQSLGVRWSPQFSDAEATFSKSVSASGETRVPAFYNVSVGGSAALSKYCCRLPNYIGYFWLNDDFTAGPKLLRAQGLIGELVQKPNVILWVQGEQDSDVYVPDGGTGDAQFVADEARAIQTITKALAVACGTDPKIFIQRLGPRIDANTGIKSMNLPAAANLAREAQEIVVNQSGYYWGAQPTIDLPLADGVHPTVEGFDWIAKQTAYAMIGNI